MRYYQIYALYISRVISFLKGFRLFYYISQIVKKIVGVGERLGVVTLIVKRGLRISFETSIATSSVSLGPMIAYPRSCLIRTPFEC